MGSKGMRSTRTGRDEQGSGSFDVSEYLWQHRLYAVPQIPQIIYIAAEVLVLVARRRLASDTDS